ncbi:GNAT family N-acetyltransferase [Cereibacter sphaeroides]|uniref:GNAT family N-acetyltransferase n=1 Tax=Cereibacter sphaeroides TaxID=1063 RepID=UPI000E5AC60D|nr:GNAT family N-acetyltransferase [Cereibacter sphaeroides]RHZ94854.1 GNAT family N-acetyltransferase [Cereibacter sphaeroides]
MIPLIRSLEAADEAAFRALWADYLTFYRVDLAPEVTDATWARLLDPASPLTGRLALTEGRLRGFALHHTHLSTWNLCPDVYLEDLYLEPSARGLGLGRALIEDLMALGRASGCGRLYWHTDEDNRTARALYDRFTPSDGHVRYRLAL